jgi:hypothetical protein
MSLSLPTASPQIPEFRFRLPATTGHELQDSEDEAPYETPAWDYTPWGGYGLTGRGCA